jgi:hypothetical protein
MPARVRRCVTHHAGCECREWRYERMERALKVIHTWAGVDGALVPEWVRDECEWALKQGSKDGDRPGI